MPPSGARLAVLCFTPRGGEVLAILRSRWRSATPRLRRRPWGRGLVISSFNVCPLGKGGASWGHLLLREKRGATPDPASFSHAPSMSVPPEKGREIARDFAESPEERAPGALSRKVPSTFPAGNDNAPQPGKRVEPATKERGAWIRANVHVPLLLGLSLLTNRVF